MLELSGLCVPYEVATCRHGDRHWTLFARGALSRSLRSPALEAWLNHRRGAVLARRSDHTLGLTETDVGVFFSLRIADRVWAGLLRDAAALGQLRGASIAWDRRSVRATWVGDLCVITAAELVEISIITGNRRPQFPGTSADLRGVA